jgi:hypothetical protein
LDLQYLGDYDKGWRALSSLTAISHLHLVLTSFISDEGANTLAMSLTALTYLDLSDKRIRREQTDDNVSDEGVRALASLVRLAYYLDLSGSELSDEGLRAFSSLTALTHLDLSNVCMHGAEVIGALCSLTSLSKLCLLGTNLDDEALSILENSLNSSVVLDRPYI